MGGIQHRVRYAPVSLISMRVNYAEQWTELYSLYLKSVNSEHPGKAMIILICKSPLVVLAWKQWKGKTLFIK